MNLMVQMYQIKDLTPSERQVVKYILDNPDEVITMRIVDLAKNTYTSPSTCMRLVRKLGFEGYTDFRLKLSSDLKAYVNEQFIYSETFPYENVQHEIELLENISLLSTEAILNSLDLNTYQQFEEIADLMHQADSIDFFGIGESMNIVRDAVTKAMRLGLHATVYSDQGLQLMQSKSTSKNRLAFIVSYTGETTIVLEIAKQLIKNSVPSVSVTSATRNSLVSLTDYHLLVEATDSVYQLGHMSSRIAMLNLFDILFVVYLNKYHEELKETLKATYNYREEKD